VEQWQRRRALAALRLATSVQQAFAHGVVQYLLEGLALLAHRAMWLRDPC